MIEFVLFIIFPFAMAMAASTDLLTMKISNWLCLGLGLSFFVVAPIVGLTWGQIGMHLLIAFGALLVCMVLFAIKQMGAGDGKLIAVTALWLGFLTYEYIILATLLGGALTLLILIARRWPLPEKLAKIEWLVRIHSGQKYVPYGIALGLAGLIVYSQTPYYKFLSQGVV